MSTSHDKVTLSAEERRLLAQLEHQALGSRIARFGSRRARDAATVLLLLAGAGLMIATFTRWPVLAVAGVIMQGLALRVGLPRCAPTLASLARRAWSEVVQSSARQRPSR